MAAKNSLTDLVEYFRETDWGRRSSVITGSFANLALVGAGSASLNAINIKLSGGFYLWVLGIIELAICATWIFMRYVRPADTETVALAFAINADSDSLGFNKEMIAAFKRHIDTNDLSDVVKIRELPTDIVFNTSKQAEKYATNKGIRVLVWGDTTRATSGNESLSIFNVRVTCQHAYANSTDRDLISLGLSGPVSSGKWAIKDSDSLVGLVLVGDNIKYVSLYTLAMCLVSMRETKYSLRGVRILEQLKTELAVKTQSEQFPNLEEFKRNLNFVLGNHYTNLAAHYLNDKHDPPEALVWTKKLIIMFPDNYAANILAARVCWEVGDRSGAHNHSKKARLTRPKERLPYLNFAFFHFYDGKHAKALAYYKQLNNKVLSTNIIDVVAFLEREYDKTAKPAMIFAAGWLSCNYGDVLRGRELLNQFIELAGKNDEFVKLVKESNRLIDGTITTQA